MELIMQICSYTELNINTFKITLNEIQHIQNLEYTIDLTQYKLHCIVGKNGVGKTTLIKAIQNFKEANTLDKLSRLNIVTLLSKIIYTIDGDDFTFNAVDNDGRYVLRSTDTIQESLKDNIFTELPIPQGKRFNHYEKLGGIGQDITAKFALGDYAEKPTELITLFNAIYGDTRFSNLEQIDISGIKYYIKPLNDENYIREDDFSSGEYMIVQIYKLIQSKCKLIVIDELDISLDSDAQIKLLSELGRLSKDYEINIVFTTHSLAIMKSMKEDELYYMETRENTTSIQNKSYNFIKGLLFQFEGYDKIILTEDKMLVSYMKYLLRDENIFSKYTMIYVAGHSQTVDLMDRNTNDNFLGTENVITVLDGDQNHIQKYQNRVEIVFIPFKSVEKDLYQSYLDGDLDNIINGRTMDESIETADPENRNKALYHSITGRRYMTNEKIFDFINNKYLIKVEEFKTKLRSFLN